MRRWRRWRRWPLSPLENGRWPRAAPSSFHPRAQAQVGRRWRRPAKRSPAPRPTARKETRARLTVEGDVERAPCALDRPEYRDIRFTLGRRPVRQSARPAGRGPPPGLRVLCRQEHPVAIICEIRDRAATILRDAGYVAAVEVPEQRIADGTVRFEVLMARLVGLRRARRRRPRRADHRRYLGQLTERECSTATRPSAICFWPATCPATMSGWRCARPASARAR
jgi:hypothetical protein